VTFPTVEVLWSFALVVGVLTLTPGVDTALVLRSAAVSGRSRAWGVVAGVQTGVLTWGALAAVGVSALLTASRLAYDVLRVAGALYLLWVGGRLLWRAVRGHAVTDVPERVVDDSFVAGWRQGAVTNLLNPKVGAFYVALLPQFIPADAPQVVWGVELAAVHVVLGTVWLGALLVLARAVRATLQRPAVARVVDGVAGTVVAGFGVRLALDAR
jgi:threonine/homoserine/homoserine lactone efflux protein